jgi:4-amino-4-deoxy-L-arabinose transferase-like glycosyltransferase
VPGLWLLALILVTAGLRSAWAWWLGPCNDEAYYALFARHPDWSYYDHPPLVGVVERLGLALAGGGGGSPVSLLPLRLGFIALSAGSTWLMARLAGRLFGPRAGLLAALGLNVSGYYGLAVGTLALPDGPLVFFWLLTLDRLARALGGPGPAPTGAWLGVGLAWGGALLSKYHAALLPLGALFYLATEPRSRACLRTTGPYLAAGVGLLLFSPVVAWNAAHGWASFAFQGGRAAAPGGWAFRPGSLAAALAGQALYLFPWVWAPMLWLAARVAGRFRGAGPAERFLLCQALPPWALFMVVACSRPILPHWPLVGFLPLFPLLGRHWALRLAARPSRTRRRLALTAALPVALAALLAGHARAGWLQDARGRLFGVVPADADPSVDLFGWDQVAAELGRRGLVDQPGVFLFAGNWYHAAQLATALGPSRAVWCYHGWDARGFAYWGRPADNLGRDGVLVTVGDSPVEPACFDRYFRRIEFIRNVQIRRAGVPVRTVHLYRCNEQVRHFPFAGRGPGPY